MKPVLYPTDPTKQLYAPSTIDRILSLGGISSAWDLGCGTGIYVQAMLDVGIEATGIEFDHAFGREAKTSLNNIWCHNLSEPVPTEWGPRDLVLSIEVAEHILEDRVDVFVANLIRLSNRWLWMTASNKTNSPGHVNPQPRGYWIGKLEHGGCTFHKDKSDAAMTFFEKLIPGKTLRWFQNSVMIFERTGGETTESCATV